MASRSSAERPWLDAFRAAARDRGMKFVSGAAFVVDDVHIASITASVRKQGSDQLRIGWTVDIKPLAVDEVLWAAFLPDVTMGPTKKINHRISGAFQVRPVRLTAQHRVVRVADGPNWEQALDEFDRLRQDFVVVHPDLTTFIARSKPADDDQLTGHALVSLITALIADGRGAEAARLADEAIARGESGHMSSRADVLKYLSAYAQGSQVHADFIASLEPTHNLQVLNESRPSTSVDVAREHHRGRIVDQLRRLDGRDSWAVVLSALPREGEPAGSTPYLQAAGTAGTMVVEFCGPGPSDLGPVRSVVGRPDQPSGTEVEIVLPRSVELISRSEVFDAEEAAELFEAFLRSNSIAEGYVLRPVERYLA
ncbi:hypothetical protein ACQCX2_08350 [Propionibacteriaceae bacterium Y1700]|uniref:hypothetical protein n=1 Tax=Microlunatus sp. Y1700 TaxID=3418487 RepID=UPI003DA797CB